MALQIMKGVSERWGNLKKWMSVRMPGKVVRRADPSERAARGVQKLIAQNKVKARRKAKRRK